MAKHDWKTLLAAFLADNAETGITAQQWCEEHGLNYQSARRYIKPRAAQSAQKPVRNTAQNAQSEKSAQKCAKDDKATANEDDGATDAGGTNNSPSEKDAKLKGRDSSGRFKEGYAGNPNPVSPFVAGNQYARKHSAYAKYLDADELFDAARESDLRDELIFTRARALSVTKTLNKIMEDLQNAESVEARIELYDKFIKAEAGLDRNIARIESIENSLSKLQLDAVNVPRLSADTLRINAATAKLKAETQRLTAENQGVETPLSNVVGEVRGSVKNGLL
ncbi:terminase [Candidatus Symbiopectobacterium sp. NZEC127]|uniref:terminase n=1 Tax=Candidatus Symbiopectobacterium sp. NZEC127 TaxID=2820472 RepID=UPI0022276076|nr:terminase [Candidatus Symbiopectobacterium sp. NZEC127]MCW2484833.1 terminase [Candidatus Symbiopectobacterium sp. NZEC127]